MAVLAAVANGNLTASGTWGLVDSTSYSNSESANTALTTSQVSSSTFTPGAITIDAIAVKIASRAASPTGTMTIQLTQAGVLVTGTNVTVNVSDLPTCTATSGTTTPVVTAEGGWFLLKLAAPVTLLAATAYAISGATSSASQVNLWSSATTNWSRFLRTTTGQAPAAGDDLIVTGEWTAAGTVTSRTVTVNTTAATDYGSNTTSQVTPATSICKGGTLSYANSASTAYIFRQSGYLLIYNGGTFNIGTSGSEIPRNSTAQLQFDCAADGDFGLVARNGATVNMYGLSRTSGKNVIATKLNANASAAATSLTVVDDTGWLNGDVIGIASTTRTATETEQRTLNANATTSGLSISSGLTNAHSGTSPTQGEIVLLTRNVLVTATSTFTTFCVAGNTATVSIQWTESATMGANVTNKNGAWLILTTTGSFNAQFCSAHDCKYYGFVGNNSALSNMTLQSCVAYNCNTTNTTNASNFSVVVATSGTWTIDSCYGILNGAGTGSQYCFLLNDIGGTCTNNTAVSAGGSSSVAFGIGEGGVQFGTFSGNSAHASGRGYWILTSIASPFGTVQNFTAWRNSSNGMSVSGSNGDNAAKPPQTLTYLNCRSFGNPNNYVWPNGTFYYNYVFDNCIANGDTTFSSTNDMSFGNGTIAYSITLWSCQFSVVSGIYTQSTNSFSFPILAGQYISVQANNSVLNGTNLANRFDLLVAQGPPRIQNNNGLNGTYFWNGRAISNSVTVFGTNTLSEEMQPTSSAAKLQSGSILVAAASGKVATPTVQVQKNGTYNGNAPRLILKRQDSMGVTADTVLATFSAGANTWQALSGSTPAATANGVFEFVIDCDGTAGSVFVGDATATVA